MNRLTDKEVLAMRVLQAPRLTTKRNAQVVRGGTRAGWEKVAELVRKRKHLDTDKKAWASTKEAMEIGLLGYPESMACRQALVLLEETETKK